MAFSPVFFGVDRQRPATPDKIRLAYGAGPVDGHDPQSFRAEGQGMLSVVCFLKHLKKWTKLDSPIK